MQQLQRQQYLKALGIVQYVPRELSPLSSHVENQLESEKVEPKRQSPINIQELVDLEERSTKPFGEETCKESNPGWSKSELSLSEPLRLTFSLWQAGERILVCGCDRNSALPDTQQLQLLSNILSAIGEQGELPEADLIEWPPFSGSANASDSEQDVREFLDTVMQARLAVKPVKYMILLGEAGKWLVDEQHVADVEDRKIQMPSGVTALMVPSLAEMLITPQAKRQTWNQLKFLAAHID